MRRTIFLYSALFALMVFVLKFIAYRFLIRDFSLEFYLGLVAVLFTVLGVWMGIRLTRRRTTVLPPIQIAVNEACLKQLGVSKREHEVLTLMAQGFSNQEIADKLFVSLNTVKTHTANLFIKT